METGTIIAFVERFSSKQRSAVPYGWHTAIFFSVVALVFSLAFTPEGLGHIPPKSPVQPSVLFEGEELVYNVRYGFIDLGQVKIVTKEKVHSNNSTVYSTQAIIQSYSGIPFVDLHAIYESLVDTVGFSRQFVARTKEGESWRFARYRFQYDQGRVVMELSGRDTLIEQRDTVLLDIPYHDGLSIFFYARDQLFSGRKMAIPTFVKEEKVKTYIDFKNERSSVETDFIDYPVDVVGFDGTAGFVGVYGLTGDFEGWFSNDEARVPIKAKMKVIVGSVTLELVSWKRPGWQPPRGSEN